MNIVLLDINMPGFNGIEVCRHIGATTRTPVIMLTARGAQRDEDECFSYGAEDYITKPFRTMDVIARIKVVLRRHENEDQRQVLFVSNGLEIDFNLKRVRLNGNRLKLTPTEYYLLEELAANIGKVLSTEHLLHEVWGPEYSDERQYVHEYIKRLRAKLEADPLNPVFIITEAGIGYRFQG